MNKKSIHEDTNFSPFGRDVSKRQSGIRLKICGMKYQDNISQVAELQPDYLGFIFYEKSARFFDGIIPKLPKSIKKTGVFVNAPLDYIIEKIKKYDLQAIQLHGNESPEFCAALRFEVECRFERSRKVVSASHSKNLNIPEASRQVKVIKVFSIKDLFDFSILEPYESVCDYYLFDTKGKFPGGNGYTFNWEVLKKYPSIKPFFLSGGIGLEEVDNVLSFLRRKESRYCLTIDVNSRFEIEPGLKEIEQLKKLKGKLSFSEDFRSVFDINKKQ